MNSGFAAIMKPLERRGSEDCRTDGVKETYKVHFNRAGAARLPSGLNRFLSQPHVPGDGGGGGGG